MKRALVAVAVVAATAAPAARRDPDIATLLAGRSAGPAQSCVDPAWAGSPVVVDDHTLLYRASGSRWWRNDLPGPCPGLNDDSIIVSEIHGGEICRNDMIRAVHRGSGIAGPTCRLGSFTPYDKPRR